MDEFVLHPHPYFMEDTAVAVTPLGGFLYVGYRSRVIYHISKPSNGTLPETMSQELNEKGSIVKMTCSSDWTEHKYFAVYLDTGVIGVLNFPECRIFKAHTGHKEVDDGHNKLKDACLQFTSDNYLISVTRGLIIKYCVATNSYVKSICPQTINAVPTGMAINPCNENLVAISLKTGSIIVMDLKNMKLIAKLLNHCDYISSLLWMKVMSTERVEKKIRGDDDSRGRTLPVLVDEDDMFDMHSDSHLKPEFGVPIQIKKKSDEEITTSTTNCKKSKNNISFEESCRQLENILRQDVKSKTGTENLTDDELSSNELSPEIRRDTSEKHAATHNRNSGSLNKTSNSIEPEEVQRNAFYFPTVLISTSKQGGTVFWNTETFTVWENFNRNEGKKAITPIVIQCGKNIMVISRDGGKIVSFGKDGDSLRITISNINNIFDVRKITNVIQVNYDTNEQIFWTIHQPKQMSSKIICYNLIESGKKIDIMYELKTIDANIHSMVICPQNPNKILFGGCTSRLFLLDLSNATKSGYNASNIIGVSRAKLHAMAWHSDKENLIACGSESSIGIIDIGSSKEKLNYPVNLAKYFESDIYSLCWARVTKTKYSSEPIIVLLGCSSTEAAYYIYNGGVSFSRAYSLKFDERTTSVAANAKYIVFGDVNGEVLITDSTLDFNRLAKITVGNKYVSSMSWHYLKLDTLAVGLKSSTLAVLNINLNNEVDYKELKVHSQRGINLIDWNRLNQNRLLVTTFDGLIMVFDTNDFKCIWKFDNIAPILSAVFSPLSENFIICAGVGCCVRCFDIRKNVPAKDNYPKIKPIFGSETLSNGRPKKVAKKKNASSIDLCKEMEGMQLATLTNTESIKYDIASTMILSTKELNQNPIELLIKAVIENDTGDIYNMKLFGSKEEFGKLLLAERIKLAESNSHSSGQLFLGQISNDLKHEITKAMETRTLTEFHVSLAPKVSFTFWKQCCLCFAHQNIENGFPVLGCNYLMACHENTEAIEHLCKTHHYREALLLVKTYTPWDVQTFADIALKWIDHICYTGNFEGAALIALLLKKPEKALKILKKRNESNEQLLKIIEALELQLSNQ